MGNTQACIDEICSYAERGAAVRTRFFEGNAERIAAAAYNLAVILNSGGKFLICGNGGSAADAQHFAAEIVGRFLLERSALPAIALTTDSSVLTAIGNDYGFEHIFSRQVEAYSQKEDAFIGISTSGSSRNILAAAACAKQRGLFTVGLTGKDGGAMKEVFDEAFIVPSFETPVIQETHTALIHVFCSLIERILFNTQR